MNHFYSKVRGIGQTQSRQQAAMNTAPGMQLYMRKPEPELKDFPHALELWTESDLMLGFVGDDIAYEINHKIDRGYRYVIVVKNLTGGTPSKPTRGVNFLLLEATPEEDENEACKYLNLLIATDPELSGVLKKVSTKPSRRHRKLIKDREAKRLIEKEFNPLRADSVTKKSLKDAKRSWNRFGKWCGKKKAKSPQSANTSLLESVISEIKKAKHQFDFSTTCKKNNVADDDCRNLAIEVFKEVTNRAWADKVMTQEESQTLKWLASKLEISSEDSLFIIDSMKPSK